MNGNYRLIAEKQSSPVASHKSASTIGDEFSPGLMARPRGTAAAITVSSAALVGTLFVLSEYAEAFGLFSAIVTLSIWSVIAVLIWRGQSYHRHDSFGRANVVTTVRAVSTAILSGFLPVAGEIDSNTWLWAIAIIATVTLCLDGLDGYLARKDRQCSTFGARFDMETDAFLALIITMFLWLSGQTGPWVLALGSMRYAFLVASVWLKPLRGELYPSIRRKTVCVIQVGALCVMLCPWVSPLQAAVIGMTALVCLSYSFAVDILWLFRSHRTTVARHQ